MPSVSFEVVARLAEQWVGVLRAITGFQHYLLLVTLSPARAQSFAAEQLETELFSVVAVTPFAGGWYAVIAVVLDEDENGD